MNESLAASFFFLCKGGKKAAISPCFYDKKGTLSKTWNAHGYKVSEVSDTASDCTHVTVIALIKALFGYAFLELEISGGVTPGAILFAYAP